MNINPASPNKISDGLTIDEARQFGSKVSLKQAGKAFEGLFLQTIMKTMREAQLDYGLFDNEAEKTFQPMLDKAYVDSASKKLNLGFGDAIERQFSPKYLASDYKMNQTEEIGQTKLKMPR